MAQAVRFAIDQLALAPSEALRMASLYPAQFLRLDRQRGYIRPGYRADLVHLDDNWNVRQSWIAGKGAH
jgi:N-acetylglucosamine-6-phosphate deacetylase